MTDSIEPSIVEKAVTLVEAQEQLADDELDLTRRYVERFGTKPHWVFESEPYDVMVRRAIETGVPMLSPVLPPGSVQ